ncbi:EamA family transporter [Mesorhizobium sp. SB112]|uniref:EamA family transporter n=1 Tax=Mesorhizobium sp. SB112 TaxID=3151853 RepID=UPI003266C0EB
MTLTVFLAVLAAAAMHAIWNALVKVNLDRFASVTLMTMGMAATALPVLPFVDFPAAHVWPWICVSVFCHMGYKLFLIRAYDAGDLAQTYPLARGTAPLLTAIGGIFVVSEMPTYVAFGGIVLLSVGTFIMSMRGGSHLSDINRRAVGFALVTSVFIAAYTLTDGSGARLATTASSYAAWLFLCDGIVSLLLALYLRGPRILRTVARQWKIGAVTGFLSAAAYWIAMWAMTKAPIASVAALRETSILFAMMISLIWLRERLTAWRCCAALFIVGGVIALRLG